MVVAATTASYRTRALCRLSAFFPFSLLYECSHRCGDGDGDGSGSGGNGSGGDSDLKMS